MEVKHAGRKETLLVTPKISIPVGFVFYQPDPELSAWYRREKALKKQKVPKAQRPCQFPQLMRLG